MPWQIIISHKTWIQFSWCFAAEENGACSWVNGVRLCIVLWPATLPLSGSCQECNSDNPRMNYYTKFSSFPKLYASNKKGRWSDYGAVLTPCIAKALIIGLVEEFKTNQLLETVGLHHLQILAIQWLRSPWASGGSWIFRQWWRLEEKSENRGKSVYDSM